MSLISVTCQSNQWGTEAFARQVDHNVRQEVRTASVLGGAIDLDAIRATVVREILSYAIPAGNA